MADLDKHDQVWDRFYIYFIVCCRFFPVVLFRNIEDVTKIANLKLVNSILIQFIAQNARQKLVSEQNDQKKIYNTGGSALTAK